MAHRRSAGRAVWLFPPFVPIMEAELPMHTDMDQSTTEPRGIAGRALVAAAIACLVLAGLLLWGIRGGAVFGDVMLAALAWCF